MQIIVRPLPGIKEIEKDVNNVFKSKYEQICHIEILKIDKLKDIPYILVHLSKDCYNKIKIIHDIMRYVKDFYSINSAGHYNIDKSCKKN